MAQQTGHRDRLEVHHAPDQPGADAEKPTDIPAAGWKQIVKRAWAETKEDNVPLMAAGVAFYAFLAIFPALIAAISIYGLVADPSQVQQQVEDLASGLPEESRTLISEQLSSIAGTSGGALSVGLAVSILGALWSASGGMGNLIKAVNLAYDEKETRGFVKLRALSLALTLGAIVFVLVAVALIAVVPGVLESVGLGAVATVGVQAIRWVGLVLAVMVALAIVYRYAPDRDNPKFAWASLGAVVAGILWIVGSVGFSFYASNFGSYSKTYGALAGVIILLMWLFLTSFIVLFGAEINAETERQTAKDTTQGPEKPMGERRATAADTVARDAG
ncbi:YihY/virulence factor BrkB family protein [Motilibacter aurantiacus]|uniref:YihY/virulence factor BrkB family protein n=1 Tax=Motilibacter aurantiacus TaxID=2714955 RepID=UPI00140D3E97|nr:YihY/virulence factor BrkB family protein [Motilibacter aurantiacus]NHC47661.1 YihY/virulence factor BrkB family protein [Motilibacter aurantiacus]